MATTTSTPTSPPKTDRFLIAIVLGIVALLVVAGIAVALSRQPVPQLPADSPGGIVQQFYTAVGQDDYDKAYDLLSDAMPNKPTREAFVAFYLGGQNTGYANDTRDGRVRIQSEKTHDAVAAVEVQITHYYNNPGPFGGSNEWSESKTFTLHQEAGAWRITELPIGYTP